MFDIPVCQYPAENMEFRILISLTTLTNIFSNKSRKRVMVNIVRCFDGELQNDKHGKLQKGKL